MVKNTNTTTAAALRTYGVPSFVVSSGISAWSSAASLGAHGTAAPQGTRLTVDIPNPMVVRDARVTAKQDRPPRGVPR